MDVPAARAPAQSSAFALPTPRTTTATKGSAAVAFGSVLGRRADVHAVATRREGRAPGTASATVSSARGASASVGGEDTRREGALGRRKHGEGEDVADVGDGAAAVTSELEAEGAVAGAKREVNEERDALDPSARHAAHLAPPVTTTPIEATWVVAHEVVRARSLEELLPALVRRIAWAGDRHRGTVRLELGAGVHAGTTVTVHADGGRVRVELGGAEGPDLDGLRARLDARLRGHGLDVESVT